MHFLRFQRIFVVVVFFVREEGARHLYSAFRDRTDASIKLMEAAEQACYRRISMLGEQDCILDNDDDELIKQLDIDLRQKKFKKL